MFNGRDNLKIPVHYISCIILSPFKNNVIINIPYK